MRGTGGERSRGPTLRRGMAVGIALCATLLAVAIAYRRPLAEYFLVQALRARGLGDAKLEVRRFDPGRIEFASFSSGDGDGIDIARIEVRLSVRGLLASRLDALKISGVRLRGTLDDDGLRFGAVDRLLEGRAGRADASAPAAIPASELEVDDALLEIVTERGPLRASLELRLAEFAPGRLEAGAALRVDHERSSLDARLSATGSASTMSGELTVQASSGGRLGSKVSAKAVSLAAKSAFSFDGGSIAIRPLDCAEIHVEGLSIEPDFSLAAPLALCLRSRSESGFRVSQRGAIEADLELAPVAFAAELRLGGEPQRLAGELSSVRLRTSGRGDDFEASLETEAGRLELAEQAARFRDVALVANAPHAAQPRAIQLRVGEIFDDRKEARVASLTLDASAEQRDERIAFAMELATSDRNLSIEIDGEHAPDRATGHAHLHLRPIAFQPDGLQPAALFPILSKLVTEAAGAIEMKGSVGWDGDRRWGRAEVAVIDFSASTAVAKFERVNSVIELDESGATPPDQILSIGRLDFGLELTDGLIRFRLEPGGAVAVETAAWKFAGGELATSGAVDLRAKSRGTSLRVTGVDLTRLIELVNLDGLSGSGRLDGEIPIALGDDLEIRNAVLRSSDEGGIIRYRPNRGAANMAAADDRFATTLAVLENFHYDKLELGIDGPAQGEVAIQIRLAGSNPDYRNGHPIDFNLSVESRLSDLLRTGIRIYRIPAEIEKRLAAFAERMR